MDKKSAMDTAIETRLDQFAGELVIKRKNEVGYPQNQKSQLLNFYKWFYGSGLNLSMVNNVGDPFDVEHKHINANTHEFEREVIQKMAPRYGFDLNDLWGIVTFSGTDGNNHGIYFGSNYLQKKTGQRPIVYVSDAAHYSSKRLADLQHLELRIIPSDVHGCMIKEEFRKMIDPGRPALIVYAIGTTFKGGVDDMPGINAILNEYPDLVVYRHLDAALFGGYLPFTKYKEFLNRNVNPFDSIAISGHKFFGLDEPAGFFITTMDVKNNQNPNEIPYLNCSMPMINCSRSALTPLKLWWILSHIDDEQFRQQSEEMLENAKWLKAELDKIGWPAWLEEMSNTVYFKKPSEEVMTKYVLAPDYDERLGGDLAHLVVMQHVNKEVLQRFINHLKDTRNDSHL